MTMFKLLAAAAAVGGLAAPVAAQVPYPYPQTTYPQTTYPGAGYPGPGTAYPNQYPYPNQYGYSSQYGYPNQGTGVVGQIIDQLLGNRYNVTDRRAIGQCANAATIQAQAQYRGYGYGQQGYGYNQGYNQGYNRGYGYQQGFAAPSFRVTAITDVQRRTSGLRVRGLMSSGYAGNPYGQYGNQYGYNQGGNYAAGDLSFRCNVDYRGAVTNVRISANNGYRNY